MTVARRIRHVDAFTSVPLEGNPAAVVDGDGLVDTDTMQRIALNQHLSETVFLFPPASAGNHASIRIFTPTRELPFAGHPTIAAAHVVLSEGIVTLGPGESLRLETQAGVIPVQFDVGPPALYTMTQRPPEFRTSDVSPDDIARWIGLSAEDIAHVEYVSTGFEWLIAQVASFDAMLRVAPDLLLLADKEISIFCIGAAGPDAQVRVRTFAPGGGIIEDPVTGSSNGCIAALIARDGLLASNEGELRYVAEQGIELGQPGRVFLRVTGSGDAMSVRVGGSAVTVLSGELLLPA